MITVKELDYSLSLKLGDPVADNGDGAIFDFEDRVKYLERAYARLIRILPKLMGTSTPMFASKKELIEQTVKDSEKSGKGIKIYDGSGKEISIEEVEELYVKIVSTAGSSASSSSSSTPTVYDGAATYIEPDKYLSVKNGKNDQYSPSVANGKIFYTFLNDSIYLLPEVTNQKYSEIAIVFRKDSPTLKIDSNVPIPYEYVDLLITFAANEGMQDIARSDKVNIYTGDLSGQLNILKGYADKIESREGSNLNG